MSRNLTFLLIALAGCEPAAASFEPELEAAASPLRYQITAEHAPALGPDDAKVNLLVFTDYQCSFCKRLEATLDRLTAAHPNEVRLQIVNYPLPFHPDADVAALAARAAGKQGRFWEMHRRLMASKGALDRPTLEAHAQALGLDLVSFRQELDSSEGREQLGREAELAKRFGVRGTPTMFVNGRRITGVRPYEVLDALIIEEIALAKVAIRNGTPIARVSSALMAGGLTGDAAEEETPSCGNPADCDCAQKD